MDNIIHLTPEEYNRRTQEGIQYVHDLYQTRITGDVLVPLTHGEVENNLNKIEAFVQHTLIASYVNQQMDYGVYALMLGIQAAFMLGYWEAQERREQDDNLPDFIKEL